MYKYVLPILAICGAMFGLVIVYFNQQNIPTPPILFPPAASPYQYAIAGTGIIETSSENISIGTPFNEIITKIYVIEGDLVKAGDKLFALDLRTLDAQLEVAQENLNLAHITLENKQKQFSFYQRLQDTKAVSEQIYQQNYYALLEAQQNIKIAESNIKIITTDIERSIIKAPIDGKILQVNIHVGEIAPTIPLVAPSSTWKTITSGTLILMGRVSPLLIRINIDESDAWRYEPGSPATAFMRGNRNINFPLTYLRTEPYIIPKSSFTGDVTERVDMRVLQVLYLFEKMDSPIYVGQLLDVYIASKPLENTLR